MLVFYALLLFCIGGAVFLCLGMLWAYTEAREYREPRTIICPETLAHADINVDGEYAARTALAGHEEFRLTDCSRWPEKEDCDQACAAQAPLVGDDRTFTQYAPGGLPPRFLRVNSPVRMNRKLYAAVKGRGHLMRGE